MEKNFLKKNRAWWIVGVAALLCISIVMMMFALPTSNAKYVSDALIDTGISGVSNEDLDALFARMMDERYPIGSIYITAVEGATPPGVNWELWGSAGNALVGIDPDNLMDGTTEVNPATFDFSGPTSGGTVGSTVASGFGTTGTGLVPDNTQLGQLELNQDGSVKITRTNLAYSGIGRMNITGPNTVLSESITLSLPAHTHSVSWWLPTATQTHAGGGNGASMYQGGGSGGTAGSGISASTGNRGGGASFQVPYENFPWASFYATYPGSSTIPPTATGPTISYIQQNFTDPVTTGGNGAVTVDDKTVQPYAPCYIYKRVP